MPGHQPGLNYLTKGRQEPEIMYKFGFDLPHFAMFRCSTIRTRCSKCVACTRSISIPPARNGFGVSSVGSLPGKPGLGLVLGYSRESLAEMQMRAIDFLREVGKPYEAEVPALLCAGIVGPRGDAYS